jgi:serine/threonine-protein kinase
MVAPLGRGGMGEVYRAEDLKLGQAVALKFLPAALRGDEGRRKRLRDEVKLARLVAHPNVCRVWDVVESDGHEFLTMEYVDGEDLASLLRRIGRLPEDRAVRMARELCAGLGAVHDQGILHRDLKPANVMVDGRGRVRLADFGLAALADDVAGAEISSGTPAYMSPEQREGRAVTVRSDVYALGLVLYEVFTGRPAGSASPSSHVKELDPAIDRAIQRCLEPDPALRPASAVAVAASLPGGDPLAAALAAGETPSPELVAVAGGAGGLRPPVAVACLAAVVAGITLVAWVGDRVSPFFLDLDKPPQVLTYEAQQIVQDLGLAPAPADSAHGFVLEGEDPAPQRLVFWYRQSPRGLSEGRRFRAGLSFDNPAAVVPGMAGVRLDAHGVLVEYVRVPAPDEAPATTAPDWPAILRRAGLETARPATPAAIPPVFGNERLAWDSEARGVPIRAEAAAFQGRPVWFRARDRSAPSDDSSSVTGSIAYFGLFLVLAMFLLAGFLARRHLRMGRGDRDGARRIAVFGAFGVIFSSYLLEPSRLGPAVVWLFVLNASFITIAYWVCYLALEPLVRRRWPDTLVSWTRLLRGRLLDPLVGRDVLLGVLGGVVVALVGQAGRLAQGAAAVRWPGWSGMLAGRWTVLGASIGNISEALLECLFLLLLLALFRQVLRRSWAALAAALMLLIVPFHLGSLADLVSHILIRGLLWGLLIRPGLLAAVVAMSVRSFLGVSLMTTHLGAWYADQAISGIVATLALAAWGFKGTLGGRPLFGESGREAA